MHTSFSRRISTSAATTMMTLMHIVILLMLMVPVTTLTKDVDFIRTDFRPYKQTWDIFKKDFKRLYNKHEDIMRFKVFVENVKKMERHNQDYLDNKVSFTMGINQFTDKMEEEEVYSCHVDDEKEETDLLHHRPKRQSLNFCERYRPPSNTPIPKSLDWRDKEVVTCVGDQGKCGSCYSFGVTTTIAAQLKLKSNKKLTALSEQQLVDCFRGCNGSNAEASFKHINSSGGIMSFNDYPYRRQTHKQGRPGSCEFTNKTKAVAKVTGCKYSLNNETALKYMVATEGPVYARIAVVPSFQSYEKGVFAASNCVSSSGHCVTVIGYGTDPRSKKDYWIIQNSWGPGWGIGGYGWIQRGTNMCRIAQRVTVPVVEPVPDAVSSASMPSKNDPGFLSTVLSVFLVFYSLTG